MTSDSPEVHGTAPHHEPAQARETKPIRIALLGCGAMGEIVARRVYSDGGKRGYEAVAAIDNDLERARTVAAVLGVEAYASLEKAQESTEIDAVDIRVPHEAHAAVMLSSLGRGLHVLVEKPLAMTLAQGREMLDADRSSDRTVAVAENYPHLEAVAAAHEAITAGRIGDVLTIRTTRAFMLDGVWVRNGWRLGAGPSAGILLDQGTHHASLLRTLGGEIVSVAAQSSRGAGTARRGSDTVLLTLRFASGIVASSLYCWGTPARGTELEGVVFGTKGRIEIGVSYEPRDGRAVLFRGSEGATPLSPPENYYDSHRSIIRDWVSASRHGHVPRVTVSDALKDLEVVIAAKKSLEHGGAVVPIGEAALTKTENR